MNDDTAVREMLHDLTLGQPDAPVDRMVGVRRRHVRRRSLQGATTVVTAAAAIVGVVLGVGVLTGSGTDKPKSLHQPPPKSWQLPWPDRSLADGATVRAQALAYQRKIPYPVSNVHWLFAGHLQTGTTWAVFEADIGSPGQSHQLVAMSSPDNGRTWATSSNAPPPASTKQIGFGRDGDRWLLILTAPGTRQVGLSVLSAGSAQVLPNIDTSDGVVGYHLDQAPSYDSVLVGPPDLSSTFLVGFPNSDNEGLPPKWESARAPSIPGYRIIFNEAGAVGGTDGDTVKSFPHYYGPMLEVIRCAAQTPLTLSVTAAGRTDSQQVERCDGQNLTLHVGSLPKATKYKFNTSLSGDPAGVYSMAVYVRKAT